MKYLLTIEKEAWVYIVVVAIVMFWLYLWLEGDDEDGEL